MKPTTPEQRFVAGLDTAIEFHTKRATFDDVALSVKSTLEEVRNAFVEAYGVKNAEITSSENQDWK